MRVKAWITYDNGISKSLKPTETLCHFPPWKFALVKGQVNEHSGCRRIPMYPTPNIPYYFFPSLLRHNWQIKLYKFSMYIWSFNILCIHCEMITSKLTHMLPHKKLTFFFFIRMLKIYGQKISSIQVSVINFSHYAVCTDWSFDWSVPMPYYISSYNSDFIKNTLFIIYLIIPKQFEKKFMRFTFILQLFCSKTEIVQLRLKSRVTFLYTRF